MYKLLGYVATLPRSVIRPRLARVAARKLVLMVRNNPATINAQACWNKRVLRRHGLRSCPLRKEKKALALKMIPSSSRLKFAAEHMDKEKALWRKVLWRLIERWISLARGMFGEVSVRHSTPRTSILKEDYCRFQVVKSTSSAWPQTINKWNLDTSGCSNRLMIPNTSKLVGKWLKQANIKLLEWSSPQPDRKHVYCAHKSGLGDK